MATTSAQLTPACPNAVTNASMYIVLRTSRNFINKAVKGRVTPKGEHDSTACRSHISGLCD